MSVRARVAARARPEVLVPLLGAYFAFAAFYVWQAWRRESPAIFSDELELTQISRAIADTGHPARRGEAYAFTTLYPYFTAPAWWLHSTTQAFATVKYLGVLAMTAAIFPAYLLARIVVPRRWAVAAAVGAVAAPALSYSAILVEEPLAYPLSTLALWLLVRAALRPTRGSVALAAAAAIAATAARSQLAALIGALLVSQAVVLWRGERLRRWRAGWSNWDWVGAVTLATGAVVVLNAYISQHSPEWNLVTRLYKERLWQYGTWATGGLAIGVGVLPFLGGLAALVRPRTEPATAERTAFTIVVASAFAAVGWYAAVKGAYLSTQFSSDVVERNLIYLDPLLFAGTALLVARRGTRWWWALACGAFTLYVVLHTPYTLAFDHYPYYEAHGFAIVSFANRIFHWAKGPIETTLILLTLASTALTLLLHRLPRHGRGAAGLVAALCAAVLVWNVTAETYAANGEYHASRFLVSQFPRPFNWVDGATAYGSTVLVGQQFGTNANGENLTEFWNRSIKKVWSVDTNSRAPGPGPTLSPDLADPNGTLTPSPDTEYALAVNGVALQAPVVPTPPVPRTTLYRLDGRPLKLAYSQSGVESDGWVTAPSGDVPAFSAYNRFDAASIGNAFGVVRIGRIGWGGKDVPATVTVRIGTLVIGPNKQPGIGRVLETHRVVIHACGRRKLTCATGVPMRGFKNPGVPFRIEVSAFPTFVPHELDPRSSDLRHLGVQVSYGFSAL